MTIASAPPAPSPAVPNRAARRVAPITAVVALVTAALWWWVADTLPLWGGRWTWALALVVGFAVTESAQLHVEFRRQTLSLSLSEIPLVLGLFLVGPLPLLLCRLAGTLLVARRRRTALYKVCFNVPVVAGDIALVVLLFHALAGRHPSTGPQLWLASYVAVLTATLLISATVLVAIVRVQGRMNRADITSSCWLVLVSTGFNCSVALLARLVSVQDPRALLILVVLAAALAIGYRAYSRLLQRHKTLGLMREFTAAVSAVEGTSALTAAVLTHVRAVLTADYAELALVAPTSAPGARSTAGPVISASSGSRQVFAAPPPDELVSSVLATDPHLLVPRSTRDPKLRSWLARRELRDAAAVALPSDEGSLGYLLVGDRLGETDSFQRVDVQLLELVAAHLSVALRNGELVDRLRYDAGHDALTGLPNRTLFRSCLHQSLLGSAGRRVAVLLMDLDEFKDINDTLGHDTGDGLLREVGRRLRAAMPEPITVARLGGDEFAALAPLTGSDPDEVMSIASLLQNAVREPFELAGVTVRVRASVGVAVYPDHAADADLLLQHADGAMYASKSSQEPVKVYNADLDRSNPRRLALVSELRQAIEGGDILCYYQPKVSLDDQTIIGVEALARWRHPRLGLVPPDDFIPIAEHTGQIVALTSHVLTLSLTQCARWLKQGRRLGVAVNVSPRGLLAAGFAAEVRVALTAAGVPPGLLTLEITEGGVMSDPDRALLVLQELHELGVALSIDDFGTGYSSLAYLLHLPVDEVKIDKSFVLTLATSPRNTDMVRAIIELGHTLGLRVVAEGVEDLRSQEVLTSLHCDVAQGYLISRPVPAHVLDQWLTRTPVMPRQNAGAETSRRHLSVAQAEAER